MSRTEEVMTPEDLAREWKVSRQTIYKELRANRIPHCRVGDRYLISREIAARLLRGEYQSVNVG
jgi:excisionase family DNA binding protein